MVICKILRTFIIIIFFTVSSSVKSEINLLDRKVSAVDLILLKYEIFLTKNFNRLYQKSGIPQTMILYQYIDSTVKYNEENGFFVNIYAYMDRRRYTKEKKYSPKISDCNAVRNKIFLNKVGYDLLNQKKNNFVSESEITNIIASRILSLSGISFEDKERIINDTQIEIEIIHPNKFNSIKCNGRINQVELL
tara:strand:+ start:317 stop:892 length:576 start_codon:yes stop_codon:yes gene_type:complete